MFSGWTTIPAGKMFDPRIVTVIALLASKSQMLTIFLILRPPFFNYYYEQIETEL